MDLSNCIKKIGNTNIDNIDLQKMIFIFNALENGWTIKKNNEKYIFKKKLKNKKEILLENYLKKFVHKNFDI